MLTMPTELVGLRMLHVSILINKSELISKKTSKKKKPSGMKSPLGIVRRASSTNGSVRTSRLFKCLMSSSLLFPVLFLEDMKTVLNKCLKMKQIYLQYITKYSENVERSPVKLLFVELLHLTIRLPHQPAFWDHFLLLHSLRLFCFCVVNVLPFSNPSSLNWNKSSCQIKNKMVNHKMNHKPKAWNENNLC